MSLGIVRRNDQALHEPDSEPRQGDFEQHLRSARAERDSRPSAPPRGATVTARSGDTLAKIAREHSLSTRSLFAANPQFDPRRGDGVVHTDRDASGGWDPDYIRPGDRIRLPPGAQHQRPPGQPGAKPQPVKPRGKAPNSDESNAKTSEAKTSNAKAPDAKPSDATQPSRQSPAPDAPASKPSDAATAPSTVTTPQPSPAPQTPTASTAASSTPAPTNAANSNGPSPASSPVYVFPHALLPAKVGIGIEGGAKVTDKIAGSAEPYAKASWKLGSTLDLNVKYKARANLSWSRPANAGKTPASTSAASANDGNPTEITESPKQSLLKRAANRVLPKSIDVGVVVNKTVEVGASIEFGKGRPGFSTYVSGKDSSDVLRDTKQAKLKLSAREVWRIANGTHEDVGANGRWGAMTKLLAGSEVAVSWEKNLGDAGSMGGYATGAVKSTSRDIERVSTPPDAAPRPIVGAAGFASGTAANVAVSYLTDKMVGEHIAYEPLRHAVDGFAGATAGLAVDAVIQNTAPTWTANIAEAAAPVAERLAPLTSRLAPVAETLAPMVAKAAPVLSKLGPVAGPAGTLLAGVPDAVDAYREFKSDNAAEGWKSVGRAATKVVCTGVGAAAGSLLGPLGTAAGAVAGGFVGDLLAKLF